MPLALPLPTPFWACRSPDASAAPLPHSAASVFRRAAAPVADDARAVSAAETATHSLTQAAGGRAGRQAGRQAGQKLVSRRGAVAHTPLLAVMCRTGREASPIVLGPISGRRRIWNVLVLHSPPSPLPVSEGLARFAPNRERPCHDVYPKHVSTEHRHCPPPRSVVDRGRSAVCAGDHGQANLACGDAAISTILQRRPCLDSTLTLPIP